MNTDKLSCTITNVLKIPKHLEKITNSLKVCGLSKSLKKICSFRKDGCRWIEP